MLESQARGDANWDGEESMQDAVLRMLVDKYKPLRSGSIRSAEEKLRSAPPRIGMPVHEIDLSTTESDSHGPESPARKYQAGEPLLPAIEGHKPWHTTFVAPSHATSASVKYGRIPPLRPSSGMSSTVTVSSEEERTKAMKAAREAKRRNENAGRLEKARESTLDYRLGISRGAALHKSYDGLGRGRPPNPATLKGWASLIDEKIEVSFQPVSLFL